MTVTIEEAQASLNDLIAKLSGSDEVLITRSGQPIAKLVSLANAVQRPIPQPGFLKGHLTVLAEDNEHLVDFAEYMP